VSSQSDPSAVRSPIQVLVDDLAFLAVDAVLRPADDVLDPVTPAAARLDAQAGPAFTRQRRVRQPLDPGAAVVTGGGELAAPLVVHLVQQSPERAPDAALVRRALVSAWQRAAEWQLGTVAAPLVGAGAGQLAAEDAARLLVETYLEQQARTGWPRKLQVVLEREDDRPIVDAVLRRAF
jgi:O-acetyl-ADP-ribose deacetylase (regulator of RNase III)